MLPVDQAACHVLEKFSTRTYGGVPTHNNLVVFGDASWPIRIGRFLSGQCRKEFVCRSGFIDDLEMKLPRLCELRFCCGKVFFLDTRQLNNKVGLTAAGDGAFSDTKRIDTSLNRLNRLVESISAKAIDRSLLHLQCALSAVARDNRIIGQKGSNEFRVQLFGIRFIFKTNVDGRQLICRCACTRRRDSFDFRFIA